MQGCTVEEAGALRTLILEQKVQRGLDSSVANKSLKVRNVSFPREVWAFAASRNRM